ncbi:CLUH, partial [Cordylochernes scorpioides]
MYSTCHTYCCVQSLISSSTQTYTLQVSDMRYVFPRYSKDFLPNTWIFQDSQECLTRQRQLVRDAADFLLNHQIPKFVKECLEQNINPIDGPTLTEALHSRGINIRYLGKVVDVLKDIPTLDYLHFEGVPNMEADAFVANSNMSTDTAPLEHVSDIEWMGLTPSSLWASLRKELQTYYLWEGLEEGDGVDAVVTKYNIQKISMLRSILLKTGIQVLLRDYTFNHRSRPTFTNEDILNIFPVVKHINPRASDAYNFYNTGQTKITQGYIKEGYELIQEALNLLNNVYGALHPEIAQCLRMLARLNYFLAEYGEAMSYQQKAVLMSERVNGIDHPSTITEYTHLALYCFANSQVTTALKLLYRARYLSLVVSGENHPDMAVLDSNIGLILHAVGEHQLALQFLENALKLSLKYYKEQNLKIALAHHLVARTKSFLGDFRNALSHERKTHDCYKTKLGVHHKKTKESMECLRHLTEQAVTQQRRINEAGGLITPLPIQVQPPSLHSVLDLLNAINGIVFIQL